MKINIAYSCNEAYVQHTGISMISLFENNIDIDLITIYFIGKEVSDDSLLLLRKITEKYKREIIIIHFETICYDLNITDTGRHIETIYAKLFFTRIESIDKILYLDSDTIVNGSLKELWQLNMDNFMVAGVETYTVDVKEKLNLLPEDNFINDGVALLNLKLMRSNLMDQKFLNFISKYSGNPPLLSEGTINKVCKGSILLIHPKYNLLSGLLLIREIKHYESKFLNTYYSNNEIEEAKENPIIIHFLSAFYNRPWDINCSHPFLKKYLFFKSLSPWKNVPLSDNKIVLRLRIINILYKILPFKVFKLLKRISKHMSNK